MSDPNLNIRLPAELKARVAAQAESLGRSLSDHSRAIIASTSVDQTSARYESNSGTSLSKWPV